MKGSGNETDEGQTLLTLSLHFQVKLGYLSTDLSSSEALHHRKILQLSFELTTIWLTVNRIV